MFKYYASALFTLLLLFSFQNCSSRSGHDQTSGSHSTANGGGYDGKVFVEVHTAGRCADGSIFNAKIVFSGGNAILVRDNCQDLSAADQHTVAVTLIPNDPSHITYDSRTFVEDLSQFNKPVRDGAGNTYIGGNLFPPDSTYGVAGEQKTFLAKLDVNGQILWSQQLALATRSQIRTMTLTSDGTIIAIGSADDDVAGTHFAWAAGFSSDGQVQWSKKYSTGTPNGPAPLPSRSFADTDGTFYFTGQTLNASAQSGDGYLIKIGTDGAPAWQRVFHGDANASLNSVTFDSSNVFVTGMLDSANGALFKFDRSGNLIWSKQESRLRGPVKLLSDGNLLVGGADGLNGLLAKIDSNGVVLWANAYGTGGSTNFELINDIAERADGSLVVLGSRFSGPALYGEIYSFSATGGYLWNIQHTSGLFNIVALDTQISFTGFEVDSNGTNGDTFLQTIADGPNPTNCDACSAQSSLTVTSSSMSLSQGPGSPATSYFTAAPLSIQTEQIKVKLDLRP